MNEQINVKILKSKLTIEDHKKILNSLDIPIFNETETTINYWTGDKNKDAYKGSPGKLVFYKDNKVYVGYTSGRTYDIISLCQVRLNLLNKKSSFLDAINFILECTNIQSESVQRINKPNICNWQSNLEKFIRFKNNESVSQEYDDSILLNFSNSYYEGWINEGISIRSMIKYEIRYYDYTNQIVIPCRDKDGNLIGIRCRNLHPDRINYAKYIPLILFNNKCYKFNTNNEFYGIYYNWPAIKKKKEVILVEGEKSVLKADTWFNTNSNVLALYGSQLGLHRRNQLVKMGVNKVILALDSDFHNIGDKEYEAFEKKIFSLGKLFKGYAKVSVIYNNIGLKNAYKCSPFDFTLNEYKMLYDNQEAL